MTAAQRRVTLPLQGSPRRMPIWLALVLFGVPAAIIVASFTFALAHGAPPWPVLVAGALALFVSALAMLWIRHMLGRIEVALEGDALVVDAGAARKRFPLATLRANGLRIVSLDERTELRPLIRTWGIGMPGLASGRFRLRNGEKAICILTGRERVAVMKSDDGTWILLSLADASVLRDALRS
jgi:hypothetical protein